MGIILGILDQVNSRTIPLSQTSPNYSSLDSNFTYFAVANPNVVYQDTARTTIATDGTIAKGMTERISGSHPLWVGSETRMGYWNTKYGSRYNHDYPIYKYPSGDIPHIMFSNYLDMIMQATVTNSLAPNTRHTLVRSRRAVSFEGLSAPNQISLKDFSGLMQIGNDSNSGAFVTVTGSTSIPEDVWTFISVVDSGSKSKLYFNGLLQGSASLGAGTLSAFGLGTISHVYEMDVAFIAIKTGTPLDDSGMQSLSNSVNSIVPLGSKVNQPFSYNHTAVFDNIDSFSVTKTFNQGSPGLPIDTSRDEYEWFIINAAVNAPNGSNGLDAIRPVFGFTGSILKRGDWPSYFPSSSVGKVNNVSVACAVKSYNTNGQGWSGIPLRSRYLSDNVLGSPTTSLAPTANAAIINDNLKTAVDITYTGSVNLNTGSGLYSDFSIKVDEVGYPAVSMSFLSSTQIRVYHSASIINTSVVRVEYRPTPTNPLKGTNNQICEPHVSGPFYTLQNLIQGDQTVKINITAFGNTTSSPGWINIVDSLNTTGSKASNMNDINGTATGITFNLTDIFDNGSYVNSVPPTDADIPDANITTRCFYEYGDGTQQATVRLEGFTSGKLVDIKLKFYKDSSFPTGAATGVVTWNDNGGSSTSNIPSNLTLATVTKTGLVADSSGYVSFTIKSDTGNFAVGLCAIIFTKYT